MIKSIKKAEEFIADTIEDLELLPTDAAYAGSTCLVIEGSKVFILNTEGEWKEI